MNNNKKFMIISILSIILFSMALAPVELQNDTFYTIKLGEHILEHGVDMQDPFSWHEDLIYTYPHWAYDVLMYLIYAIGGLTGIYISTLVLSSILGLSIYAVNTKLNRNPVIAFITTLGVMYCLESFIAARAQLVTFIIMVWVIYFIEKFLEKHQKRYAIGLIISFLLVANMHAALWPFFFVLFLPYIGEYVLSIDYIYIIKSKQIRKKIRQAEKKNKLENVELLNKRLEKLNSKKEELDKKKENPYKLLIRKNDNMKYLFIVIILCALTGLLTPQNTFEPYTHLPKLMMGTTTSNISEHQPIVLADEVKYQLALGLMIAAIGFLDSKMRLSDLFMVGGLTFLAIQSRRQFSILVLLGGIILVRLVTQAIEKKKPKIAEELINEFTDVMGIIITIIAMLIIIIPVYGDKKKQIYVNEGSYPVNAVEFIKENLTSEDVRLFNEYNYGSYLLYHDIPVFIDSRADLYSPEFNGNRDIFRDFINAEYGHEDYEKIFQKYGITHIILNKSGELIDSVSTDSRYNQIYSDAAFEIYERAR